jgi:dipeptidase E
VHVRLYLSSTGLGADPTILRALAPGPRVGIVVDADDEEGFLTRRQARRQEFAALAAAGFTPTDLDLRRHRDGRGDLAGRLAALDVVWLAGGNTFVLARAMRRAGLAAALREPVASGALLYAGYSAGACVAGPDLRGVDLMDDPGGRSAGEPVETLALVDYRVVPHWRSDSRLSASAELMAAHLQSIGLEHRCLSDGQALVVEDGVTSLV